MDELLSEHMSGIPHPNFLKRQMNETKRRAKHKKKTEEIHRKKKKKKGMNSSVALNNETVFLKVNAATTVNKAADNEIISFKTMKEVGEEKNIPIPTPTIDKVGADEGDFREDNTKKDGKEGFKDEFPYPDKQETKFCWECQIDVHTHSMHCRHCAKCVSHFDHHCVWFNTCIGSENYVTFYRSVLCLTLFTSFHVATIILYIVSYLTDSWNVRRRSQWLGGGFPKIVLGVNISMGVFVIVIALIIMQLLLFHRRLRREGMTTYQFTVMSSKLEQEKTILSNQVKETRELELSRIRSEGGSLNQRVCIQMGGMKLCRPCDPVRKMPYDEKIDLEDISEINNSVCREKDTDSNEESDKEDSYVSNLYEGAVYLTSSLLSFFNDDNDK